MNDLIDLSDTEKVLLAKARMIVSGRITKIPRAVTKVLADCKLDNVELSLLSKEIAKILIREIRYSELQKEKADMLSEERIAAEARYEGIWPQNTVPSPPQSKTVYVPPSARLHQRLSEYAGACESDDDK